MFICNFIFHNNVLISDFIVNKKRAYGKFFGAVFWLAPRASSLARAGTSTPMCLQRAGSKTVTKNCVGVCIYPLSEPAMLSTECVTVSRAFAFCFCFFCCRGNANVSVKCGTVRPLFLFLPLSLPFVCCQLPAYLSAKCATVTREPAFFVLCPMHCLPSTYLSTVTMRGHCI